MSKVYFPTTLFLKRPHVQEGKEENFKTNCDVLKHTFDHYGQKLTKYEIQLEQKIPDLFFLHNYGIELTLYDKKIKFDSCSMTQIAYCNKLSLFINDDKKIREILACVDGTLTNSNGQNYKWLKPINKPMCEFFDFLSSHW